MIIYIKNAIQPTNNNCVECKNAFKFIFDSESTNKNCYEICDYYYYFTKIINIIVLHQETVLYHIIN